MPPSMAGVDMSAPRASDRIPAGCGNGISQRRCRAVDQSNVEIAGSDRKIENELIINHKPMVPLSFKSRPKTDS